MLCCQQSRLNLRVGLFRLSVAKRLTGHSVTHAVSLDWSSCFSCSSSRKSRCSCFQNLSSRESLTGWSRKVRLDTRSQSPGSFKLCARRTTSVPCQRLILPYASELPYLFISSCKPLHFVPALSLHPSHHWPVERSGKC